MAKYKNINKECIDCGRPVKRSYNKYCSPACYWKNKHDEPWNKGLKTPQYGGIYHYEWKGEDASYIAKHAWIHRQKGKPSLCEHCKTTTAKKFEWANVSKEYKRDLNDYIRLCTSCHRKYDETWLIRERDQKGRFI